MKTPSSPARPAGDRRRVEHDAGETKKGQNHPNLPLFAPTYNHAAALKRLRAKNPTNRALRTFAPAPIPTVVLSPRAIGTIVNHLEGCPAGWWAPDGSSRAEHMAAYEHRMRLIESQRRLRERNDG